MLPLLDDSNASVVSAKAVIATLDINIAADNADAIIFFKFIMNLSS